MKRFDLLIIDDERRFADMLAKRLEIRGLACMVGYNGSEGLGMVQEHEFDLVVLDLCLPDIHGAEVLSRILETSPCTPVIMVTGHGSYNDRLECMNRGAYGFYNKPLEIERLISILEETREKSA
jgi:DNA-binding NtrC family response regulator